MEKNQKLIARREKTSCREASERQPCNVACHDLLAKHRHCLACDLPERFGPWQSVYTRMRRWNDKGIWNQVVEELVKLDIIDRPAIVWNNAPIKNYSEEEKAKTPY